MKKIIAIAAMAFAVTGCASSGIATLSDCAEENAQLTWRNERLVTQKVDVDRYLADYKTIPGWEHSFLTPKQLQAFYSNSYNNAVDELVERAAAHNKRCAAYIRKS